MITNKVKVGDVFTDTVGDFRIMAIAEGYFMGQNRGNRDWRAHLNKLKGEQIA